MVLAPIFAVSTTYLEIVEIERVSPKLVIESDWWISKMVLWCLIVVPIAIGLSAGYKLRKNHRPESVDFAIGSLWIMAGWSIWSDYIIACVIFDLPFATVVNTLVKNLVSSVAGAGIWTLYLTC